MKDKHIYVFIHRFIVLLIFACFGGPLPFWGREIFPDLKFRQLSTLDGLPTDEVQKIYQDREGFIWMATRYGLCKYDGYKVEVYKSNLYHPDLLTHNNVFCLADDDNGNLWVGTQEGLNKVNKRTGQIRGYTVPLLPNNAISCLLVTHDNQVWVGTDGGLCKYIPEKDTFETFDKISEAIGGRLGAIKSLFEDKDGDLWIGTWTDGLFRYSPSQDCLFVYPRINERNSAHVIYQDAVGNIWVGGWDCGLFLLHHPKDMEKVFYTSYVHEAGSETSLSDNIVYSIVEDIHTRDLWIGTRSGLSIMHADRKDSFVNYKPRHSRNSIPCDEINSLLRDYAGNIWLASIGGGVMLADTRHLFFTRHSLNLEESDVPTSAVRAIFADSENNLWLGTGTYGVAREDYVTGEMTFFTHIPEFAEVREVPTVNTIIQRRNGEIWFGTYNGGILVYEKGKPVRVLTAKNTPFLYSDCVASLLEDSRGYCWSGCRGGLGVCLPNDKSYLFGKIDFDDGASTDYYYVKDILEDKDGSIWVATSNCGMIHIVGDIARPYSLQYYNYSLNNRKLSVNSVLCLYLDDCGRLWAGTEGGGLYLYNRQEDVFVEKNREYSIPGDMVGSIEGDAQGGLWLGTNLGLAQLKIRADETLAAIRIYTTADGLSDNFFISLSSCRRNNEFLFGGNKGYNSFFPEKLEDVNEEVPYSITDIKIFNQSLSSLNADLRQRISPDMPTFTNRLELPYDFNNFSIEFAALTYRNPDLNQYAYQLVGFDKDWQYTNASRRFAYYNNLESGTYVFRLKATNENGIWSKDIRELKVVILPPFWATWWAYTVYALLIVAIGYLSLRAIRNRILLHNELRFREMEKSKLEELTHAKLQFFTNITHELMTPLTVISATMDELKMRVPGHEDLYVLIGNNISRLLRLLQQILEFRKAETGNLQLRVSSGDVAAFVRNEAESILPLIKKRKIHFSVSCNPESILGYFDTDKLDKILYNLLSNAAKYNKEGGDVHLSCSYAENKDCVQIRVKDNGMGIPKAKQKELFSRFYEGDYRKFNTIGTGIGLALTKDLVELHKGTIQVESEEGKGAEFIVTIPVSRSYFEGDFMEDGGSVSIEQALVGADAEEVTEVTEVGDEKEEREHPYSILVVEDNEELLQLMVKLLYRNYHIYLARNGKEAVSILEEKEVSLIVSDVMMPVMDGIELCKYVKAKFEICHIPIILLTAKSKEEERAEAYEVGADAFISKPFNLSVLFARIRNLLKYRERMRHDFRNQLVFEAKELNYTSVDEDFIKRAVDCVNRHLDDGDFDQTKFVEEMGTSKSTLYKKLKSLTGMGTSSFICNIRLKAARRIMEEKKGEGIRISDLAYAVGFNNPKYFTTCFKKEFGMLPSEYLERFV